MNVLLEPSLFRYLLIILLICVNLLRIVIGLESR